MIAHLKGVLAETGADHAVVEVAGGHPGRA